MTSFDAETTENHRIARFGFVPWMARFLGGGATRQKAPELVVGDANALTDETVQAIQDISNLACWRFLVRECGWRKLTAISELDSAQYSVRRILDEGVVALPNLTFTTATVDLLITIFNATGPAQSIKKIDMPDCLSSNGDLILHHLIFRRLMMEPKSFGVSPDHRWLQWYPNPLNAILDPMGYSGDYPVKVQWQQLFTDQFKPFLPWIGEHLYQQVQSRMPMLWEEERLRDSLDWLQTVTSLTGRWLEHVGSMDRPDLQCCVFDLLIQHSDMAPEMLARFEVMHKREGETIRSRQVHGEQWNAFVELIDIFATTAQDCLAVHPVERTAAEQCFLARWEDAGLEHHIVKLRDLSRTLRPSFN